MADNKKITQAEIGRKYGKNQRFISDLTTFYEKGPRRGERKRFTTDPMLAIEVAKHYGGRPIEYINPNKRDIYLKAHPRLGKQPSGK